MHGIIWHHKIAYPSAIWALSGYDILHWSLYLDY